jgi:hypothetical protein
VRVARRDNAAAPDLSLVRRELLAAQGLAEGEWIGRTGRAMTRMDAAERSQKNIGKLRQELEKMLAENAPADVNRHLQAAWLELSQP